MQRRDFLTALTAGFVGWATGGSRNALPVLAQDGGVSPEARASQYAESQAMKRQHTDWIRKVGLEIATIKPGMTRTDLRRLFEEEAGYHVATSQLHRRYIYRGCGLIKVDVKFRHAAENPESTGRPSFSEMADDIITKISQPFIEPFEVVD